MIKKIFYIIYFLSPLKGIQDKSLYITHFHGAWMWVFGGALVELLF